MLCGEDMVNVLHSNLFDRPSDQLPLLKHIPSQYIESLNPQSPMVIYVRNHLFNFNL